MGLVNRLTAPGEALPEALKLAGQLARFPQGCMRSDRASAYGQWHLSEHEALLQEGGHYANLWQLQLESRNGSRRTRPALA